MGGLARRANYVKQVRGGDPAALLVDTGGTLIEVSDDSDARIDERLILAMAEMGYDALNAGERELNAGPRPLRQIAERSVPALISSNGELAPAGAAAVGNLLKPYLVREVAGVRVGFVGVTSASSAAKPADALRKVLPEVRRQADVIVALADLEPDEVQALATAGLDLQVILGARGGVSQPATLVGQTITAAPVGEGRGVGRLVLQVDARGQIDAFEDGQQFLDDSLDTQAG